MKMIRSARNHPWGFTLIELLVVISIIGILAAMLLPVLAKAKDRAAVANCLNNQKQLAAAWQMYSGDHEENVVGMGDEGSDSWRYRPGTGNWSPPPGAPPRSAQEAVVRYDQWGYRLAPLHPYAPNTDLVHCPADLRFKLPNINAYTSYSGVDGLGRGGARANAQRLSKVTQIKHAAERFLWVEENDARTGTINGFTFGENLGTFAFRTTPDPAAANYGIDGWWDGPAAFHNNACTFSFADGHAETRKWLDGDTITFAKSMDPGKANNLSSDFDSCRRDLTYYCIRWPSSLNP